MMFSRLKNSRVWGSRAAVVVLALLPLLPTVMIDDSVGVPPEEISAETTLTEGEVLEDASTSDAGADVSLTEPDAAAVKPSLLALVAPEPQAEKLAIADAPVAPMSPVPDDLVVDFDVSPLSARPGETVNISGVCTLRDIPATDIWGTFYRLPIEDIDRSSDIRTDDLPVDKFGRVDFMYVVPSAAKPGEYDLNISCGRDDMGIGGESFKFAILGDEIVPPSTPDVSTPAVLAETGADSGALVIGAAVAAGVLGVLLLLWTRRGRALKNR